MNPLTNMKNVKKLSEQELRLGGKSTWHDQYKDSAWIFVGGLPYDLTEGDIICIFSQYGEIVNINLVRDKESGKPRGFCFICYEDQRSTVLAVDNFNGINLLRRTIRVDHVQDYKVPKDSKKLDDVTRQLQNEGCAPGSSLVRKRTPSPQPTTPQPLPQQIKQEVDEEKLKRKAKKRAKKQKKKEKKERKKAKKRKKESSSSEEDSSSEDDSEEENKPKKKSRKDKKKSKKKAKESSSDSESSSEEESSVEIKTEKPDPSNGSHSKREEPRFRNIEIKREPNSREPENRRRSPDREYRRDDTNRHSRPYSNYRSGDQRYRDNRNRHEERHRR